MKPKRIISLLLAICLVAGLMPTVAFATGSNKAIMLGTEHLQGGQADNIYFGNYAQTDSTGNTKEPVKWRVLDDQTNFDSDSDGTNDAGLFLLSDVLLGTGTDGGVYFDNSGSDSNVWQNSTAQTWCKNFYSNNFSSKEQNAVLVTTKIDSAYTSTSFGYAYGVSSLSGDKVFFLSAEEAENSAYGFTDDNARIANYGNSAGCWWLRSPNAVSTDIAGLVDYYGYVRDLIVYYDWAARPAFNLDLNSVLFTSAAVGGKSASGMDSGLTAVGDYDGSEWKLTLLDNSRNFVVTEEAASGKPGDTITLNYTGTTTGTNEYISVIIADSNGSTLYYGRVAQPDSANGQVEIKIPDSLAAGEYTLNVFSEQYNGDYKTDYASAFAEVALTVSSDTTAPTLTPGSATRDSETAATVKFTSDEAGEYYYAVVESGDTAPTIDTTGTGTACGTTEQTISRTNLSGAGAKDIYIVAKDAAGNVSQQLKITIPAYIAPSYGISASPAALDFGSKTAGYTEAPAAQTVTLTNTGNQTVTVNLPVDANYTITAGDSFAGGTATLAPNGTAAFTVQPKTGLGAGDYSETLTISGSNGTSANVQLSFTVAFATESDKAIMLGTSGISDPTSTQNSSGTHYTPSDYVYFGVKGSDPIKWRVLDADKTNDGTTSGMFLLSEYLLDNDVVFERVWNSDDNDGQSNPNEWQHSDAQNWCSTFATNSDVFSMAEQAAFLGVTKTDNSEGSLYSSGWGTSSLTENDKVFFLSVRELADYVGNYDEAPGLCATDTAQSAGVWWLRSPYANNTYSAGLVARNGLVSLDFVYSDTLR